MPTVSPVATSASAKGSAHSRITAAANRNMTTTADRRPGVGKVPTYLAGPTRCGSSAGAFESRTV